MYQFPEEKLKLKIFIFLSGRWRNSEKKSIIELKNLLKLESSVG